MIIGIAKNSCRGLSYGYTVSGRTFVGTYKRSKFEPIDWDKGVRSRKGSWEDKKVRSQWQRHIKR